MLVGHCPEYFTGLTNTHLSFTITKEFTHGLEAKVEMKGMSLMVMICTCVIGVLCGSATTVCAGGCSQIA